MNKLKIFAVVAALISPVLSPTQAVADNSFFVPGPGFEVNGHYYWASWYTYMTNDNVDQEINWTFGPLARLASWQELVVDLSNSQLGADFLSGVGLPTVNEPNLFVSNNGSEIDPGRGRWFITNLTNIDPTACCNYLSFGNLYSSIYLGSYGWTSEALVVSESPRQFVVPEVPSALILLSGLAAAVVVTRRRRSRTVE